MNRYVVRVAIKQTDGKTAVANLPVRATSEDGARTLVQADLDRQVAEGTIAGYGTLHVRTA